MTNTKVVDYELIEQFSDRHDPFAEEAFSEFHDRYASFILETCKRFAYPRFPRFFKAVAEDLASQVFLKIYEKADEFNGDKNIAPAEQQAHLKVWIYRIIKHTFIDEYVRKSQTKKNKGVLLYVDKDNEGKLEATFLRLNMVDNIPEDEGANNHVSEQNRIRLEDIDRAKGELSAKQLEILDFYVKRGSIDSNGNWVLPQDAMDELCVKHQVKENTIIQNKLRIIKKIQEFIKVNNNDG
jgi:RNA polymerase sigma factor (sigma-70 family)